MQRIVSVNVGLPQVIEWQGKPVSTGIFKSPVTTRLRISRLNVAGDQQADLSVHGGPDKAVYAYDIDHYAYWKQQLDWPDWTYGLFGENLTTDGLPDPVVYIGSVYRVGSARLQVAQPRFPCFKLNARFNDRSMVRTFSNAMRCGIYFRVLDEGDVQAGDSITLEEEPDRSLSIRDVAEVYFSRSANSERMDQLVNHPFLAKNLKNHFKRFRWSIEK
ncbi:MOSC domain-containing protein [Fibrisoma montanum]|uniref:MOSC domain-containing protein n=1 Tax=Fibrisoma montanum TaxID=2305895 RepID=A0A418MDT2_9BACT|nr:MOSC domain-containing protein [Fibrisoma montanum]RIV24954.1 MOSC domain-containing protein [Fibrisoma montanum]